MKSTWLAALLVATPLGACTRTSLICTDEARAGITVQVTSAAGGAPPDAMVLARSGSYADSARTYDGGAGVAYERAGTYEVTVRAQGFATWTRSNVQVSDGSCHVGGVHLDVVLAPQ